MRLCGLCIALTVCMLPIGCSRGDKPIPVSGVVSVDETALADGKIAFLPVDQSKPTASAVVTDGRFSFADANSLLPGEYQVQIFSYVESGKQRLLGGAHGDRKGAPRKQVLPARFNSKSELRAVVSRSNDVLSFELRTK